MNLKMAIIGLACAIGSTSHAARLLCAGKYMNSFNVTVQAGLNSRPQINTDIHVTVVGPNMNKTADMQLVESQVIPQHSIVASAKNEDGTGRLIAPKYNAQNQNYYGTLSADGGTLGTVTFPVACVLQR